MLRQTTKQAMNRLARAESAFLGSEFLAPVIRGRGATVKIAGIRCTLATHPPDFEGWGVFRAQSHSNATLVRDASAAERRRYLRLFPPVRLIHCAPDHSETRAAPANWPDDRFQFTGPVFIQLCPRPELFETVIARFDGVHFWYDEIDPRADPAASAFLRRALARMADPKDVNRPGLTGGQRIAYALEYARRATAILADRQRRDETRLSNALAHAGAILRDFADAHDAYRVTFTVDGRRHTSVVRKDDLTVHSAGICLSGQDRDFDLNSLVGVLREASDTGRLVRY